jgi:metal-responsive CopG/Arc/MetJ family transcriptional regulator
VVKVVVGSMARKIVCNYAMDRDLLERLETLAEREEQSRSEVVRRALGRYLDRAGV